MTMAGKGAVSASTASQVSCEEASSRSPSINSWMPASSVAIRRGVKARLTIRRIAVWRGGSVMISMGRKRSAMLGAPTVGNTPDADENVEGSCSALVTSECRLSTQHLPASDQ